MARSWIEMEASATSSEVVEQIYGDFPAWMSAGDAPHDWSTILHERRAAVQLHSCTGRRPRRIDTGSRQGAVDLLLEGDCGSVAAVVEVTSSADASAGRAYELGTRLVDRINEHYRNGGGWSLHLAKGFDPPSRRVHSERLAKTIARELGQLDREIGALTRLSSVPWLYALPVDQDASRVEVGSWDSRVPDSSLTYVEQLQNYLGSELVSRKMEKLIRESIRLGAGERHLYVLASLTGRHSGMYPRYDGALASPDIQLPDGLDVLWVDTMSRSVFRLSAADGLWIYPRSYL